MGMVKFNNRAKIFSLLSVLLFCVSCSEIQFRSTGKIPVQWSHPYDYKFDKKSPDNKEVIIEGVAPFYMWGLYPKVYTVYLDQEMEKRGLVKGTFVRAHEYRSWSSFFWTLISLGMYGPVNYKVVAHGKKK